MACAREDRVGEAAHPGLVRRPCRMADVRNVFPRLGTQSTVVDSDDDRPLLRDTPQSFHYRQISSQASDCAQVAFGVPSLTGAEQGNQHRNEVTLSVFVGEAHPFTVDVDVASTAECCAHHGPQPFR